MQEGISLFDVDFVMTDHFLKNTLLIRVIGHPVIRPCKARKFHNTAGLSQQVHVRTRYEKYGRREERKGEKGRGRRGELFQELSV
jgi:hypothetical protein